MIPESMRQYLALQAIDSGKALGGNFLGRSGLMPYGSGNMMMGGDQGPQGKVGKWIMSTPFTILKLIFQSSHPPSFLSITECGNLETCGPKCYGSHHFLLA
jgi:hypothetical protein